MSSFNRLNKSLENIDYSDNFVIFQCIEKQAYRSQKCLIHRKNSKKYGKTLASTMERFSVHLTDYQSIFRSKTKVYFDKAELYTQGIIKSHMRNIERISEELGANYHQMQHFITESNWNGREVIDKVAKDVSASLPKLKLTGMVIDESGWVKKGDKSVGVGHQYCGNVGKTANSQVAVFACLSNGDFASMIDARLYLPKDWCDDPARCIEIKYSFTNANLEQYTPEVLAYMQAERFFVEHCIKESKQILGLDQFQTRMWNAWVHQVALNFMVSSFMLKEKLFCFDDLPLLSARDIKEYLTFKLYKNMTEEQMIDKIYNRHSIRQIDINNSYLRV